MKIIKLIIQIIVSIINYFVIMEIYYKYGFNAWALAGLGEILVLIYMILFKVEIKIIKTNKHKENDE